MSYLVDTNVLLRSVQTSHPMHSDAVRAIHLLLNDENSFSNSSEFYRILGRRYSPRNK